MSIKRNNNFSVGYKALNTTSLTDLIGSLTSQGLITETNISTGSNISIANLTVSDYFTGNNGSFTNLSVSNLTGLSNISFHDLNTTNLTVSNLTGINGSLQI